MKNIDGSITLSKSNLQLKSRIYSHRITFIISFYLFQISETVDLLVLNYNNQSQNLTDGNYDIILY